MNQKILVNFDVLITVMKNKNIKRILALFFWGVLLFPSFLNIVHQCQLHDHFECNEQKAHLHQSITDCDICDFNLLNFSYDLESCDNLEQPKIFTTLNASYKAPVLRSSLNQSTQLRAPPVMS
tara:strand:+ start:265 stop:633 length:369 start_codon:yes stop_codon:yes gene_type:complete